MTSLILLLTACIVKNFDKKAKYYFNKPHQRLKAGIKRNRLGIFIYENDFVFAAGGVFRFGGL
jgi:hypothetical protein